jgi:hypothetical protein
LDAGNFGKLFLRFSRIREHEFETRLPPGLFSASRRGFAFCVADPIGCAHESTRIGSVQSLVVAGYIRFLAFSPKKVTRLLLFAFVAETNPHALLKISR